jgi:tetratricopeptide (TPR) repeat protein
VWYLNRALALAPNDWQLYADRARAHEKLGKVAEWEADQAAAVARGADSSFLVGVAEAHARQGQWDKAAAAFTTAHERGAIALAGWYCHALVCLKVGDGPGYRRICERLLQQAGPKPHPGLANSLAWDCVLGPDAVSDYTQPLALAELALEKAPPQDRPLVLNTLGALLYRAGRFQEAAGRLRQSIQANGSKEVPQDWLFLAMTQHRLGDTAEARKSLARVKQTRAANSEALWNNVEVELLRREAQELVEGKESP